MERNYYLGLDIGTDSVGYAVTGTDYSLCKFKGEPVWGTHLFEGGQEAADRRIHRANRRRIDRRQQRIRLVDELFADAISKIDPDFFIRRKCSALFEEDGPCGGKLFAGDGITDEQYHKQYPTIHHLILDLMTCESVRDVRLVYMACAWLVAHRGHFLFDIDAKQVDQLLNFSSVYEEFREFLTDQQCAMPWEDTVSSDAVLSIIQMETGITKKKEAFKTHIYGGKKIAKEPNESFFYSADAVVGLLSGGTVKPKDLYNNEDYAEVASVSLEMGDEEFDQIIAELEEDGELLVNLRRLYSCARLIATMSNRRPQDPECISSSKVAIYEQHRKDLKVLKAMVKQYCPKQYNEIFRSSTFPNYVAYSGNMKSTPEPRKVKRADKVAFCDYLKKKLKSLQVQPEDRTAYEDLMQRLESYRFLPKQRDSDNRIIPQQLYRQELNALLERAQSYLPWLSRTDEDGFSITEKILSIFDYRIPYYVGPLVRSAGGTAWIMRKQGRILPWNFEQMVDLDASEQAFIDRMTNSCTYLPGEDVVPEHSLLYEKYVVLNELNNLKLNDCPISPERKQELFTNLFCQQPRVSFAQIRNYLLQHGYMTKDDTVTGLDKSYKSGLKSFFSFRRLLERQILSEQDVEDIILHGAYTEDKSRMRRWLKEKYPHICDEDVSYILRQNLKGFGRLSQKFLTGLYGAKKNSDGEALCIIEALWETNDNLMQLLSDKYTFAEQIRACSREYYSEHPKRLTDRLSEMYVANGAKRPIFRTLDIVTDVVKAMGTAPEKIFVEMARGSTPEQKGKRTQSRAEQLLALYRNLKDEVSRKLADELKAMGVMAEQRLQDRKLYLYYLQLGKCAYTERPIDLSKLADGTYNLEHIFPQSLVKDDSILNNLVLVESTANGQKSDSYPISWDIRQARGGFWQKLKNNGLMTEEKFRRLTRCTPFTADEKMGFINRQLVETRQSTKIITTLLKEQFPDTQIVYVKAGLVSEFRQEFEMLKCRSVNDLHHAKDAYLNIVVGNVYHERFTKEWFRLDEHYNVQAKKLFTAVHRHNGQVYWNGEKDLAAVRKTVAKNAIHLTRYAFYRKGGLFDQQPVKAAPGLIPLKKGLPTEKYGGYNKPTATGYYLARFLLKGKQEVMLVPVELHAKATLMADQTQTLGYVQDTLLHILGKAPEKTEILLEGRMLKINTVFSLDGTYMTLAGKSSGGEKVLLSPIVALTLPKSWENYAKALESFQKKLDVNKNLEPNGHYDGITAEKNVAFYRLLTEKMNSWPFINYPGNQGQTMVKGEEKFVTADPKDQVGCLMNILLLMGSGSGGADLSVCGGASKAGAKAINAKLSNWASRYKEVSILDMSASGLYGKKSRNLLELL